MAEADFQEARHVLAGYMELGEVLAKQPENELLAREVLTRLIPVYDGFLRRHAMTPSPGMRFSKPDFDPQHCTGDWDMSRRLRFCLSKALRRCGRTRSEFVETQRVSEISHRG